MYIHTVTIALYLLVYSFFSLTFALLSYSLTKLSYCEEEEEETQQPPPPPPPSQPKTTQILSAPQDKLQLLIIQTQNWPIINRISNQNQQKSRPNSTKNHKSTSPQPKKPISPQLKKTHVSWLLLLIRSKEWVANQDWRIKRAKLLIKIERVKLGLGCVRSRKG